VRAQQVRERLLGTIPIAGHHYDAGAEPRQSFRSALPDSRGGPGDDDDLAENGGLRGSDCCSHIRTRTQVAVPRPGSPVFLRAVPKI
jgi:hypothetical protein